MPQPPHRRACLVGVGETRYARWGGITDASEHALALEAILSAVADAGLSVDDVDGLTSFAGDRNAIGRNVQLNGEPYTIVGVMPPGFGAANSTDAWVPMAFKPDELAGDEWVFILALELDVGRHRPFRGGVVVGGDLIIEAAAALVVFGDGEEIFAAGAGAGGRLAADERDRRVVFAEVGIAERRIVVAEDVDGNDRPRARRDPRLDRRRVEVERPRVDVGEDRCRALVDGAVG